MRGGSAWLDFGPSSGRCARPPSPRAGEKGCTEISAAFRPGVWRAARSGVAGDPTASGVWKREAGRPPGPAAPRAALEDERKIPGRFQPLRASLVGPCLPSAASNRVVSPAFDGRRPRSTSSRCRRPSVDQSMDRDIGILSACQAPFHALAVRPLIRPRCARPRSPRAGEKGSAVIPGGAARRKADPGGLARGALRPAFLDPLPAPAARRG